MTSFFWRHITYASCFLISTCVPSHDCLYTSAYRKMNQNVKLKKKLFSQLKMCKLCREVAFLKIWWYFKIFEAGRNRCLRSSRHPYVFNLFQIILPFPFVFLGAYPNSTHPSECSVEFKGILASLDFLLCYYITRIRKVFLSRINIW